MSHSVLPSPYPLPGEIIDDKWRVERILGEGGMGAVALAWDLVLHTPVAIKFMNPQFLTFPGADARFVNEGAKILHLGIGIAQLGDGTAHGFQIRRLRRPSTSTGPTAPRAARPLRRLSPEPAWAWALH